MASGGGRRRKPRPRPRAKGKKTKYLSLSSLIIKAEPVATPPPEEEVKREDDADGGAEPEPEQQQQLEPFALHHEASTLFAALPAPSLTEILGASAGADESPSASPEGASGGAGFLGAKEEDLARRALRGRERWVYCSGSASPATTTTTASSSPCSSAASTGASARSLLLKLDYEEILAAWADRGSLYIGGAADGATAPEPELDNVFVHMEPSENASAGACAWSAPETAGPERAERVRRYKEKRRTRLFAKRIRYEVRRINAVKRPRFKGRFIKGNEESELPT